MPLFSIKSVSRIYWGTAKVYIIYRFYYYITYVFLYINIHIYTHIFTNTVFSNQNISDEGKNLSETWNTVYEV